jgi:hypothetical protein
LLKGHLAYFINDTVASLNTGAFHAHTQGCVALANDELFGRDEPVPQTGQFFHQRVKLVGKDSSIPPFGEAGLCGSCA